MTRFSRSTVEPVQPNGQAVLQAKFDESSRPYRSRTPPTRSFAADGQGGAVGQANSLGQMVEHHPAAERLRQGRDEQAVIAPRGRPAIVPEA